MLSTESKRLNKQRRISQPKLLYHQSYSEKKLQRIYLEHLRSLIIIHDWHLNGGGKTYFWSETVKDENKQDEIKSRDKTLPWHIYLILEKIELILKGEGDIAKAIVYIRQQFQAVLADHNERKKSWWYRIFGRRSSDTVDFCAALDMPYDVFLFLEEECKQWLIDVFFKNMNLANNQAKANGHTVCPHTGVPGGGQTIVNAPRNVKNLCDKIQEAQHHKITYYQATQGVNKTLAKIEVPAAEGKKSWFSFSFRRSRINSLYEKWREGCAKFLEAIQGIKVFFEDCPRRDSFLLISPYDVKNIQIDLAKGEKEGGAEKEEKIDGQEKDEEKRIEGEQEKGKQKQKEKEEAKKEDQEKEREKDQEIVEEKPRAIHEGATVSPSRQLGYQDRKIFMEQGMRWSMSLPIEKLKKENKRSLVTEAGSQSEFFSNESKLLKSDGKTYSVFDLSSLSPTTALNTTLSKWVSMYSEKVEPTALRTNSMFNPRIKKEFRSTLKSLRRCSQEEIDGIIKDEKSNEVLKNTSRVLTVN